MSLFIIFILYHANIIYRCISLVFAPYGLSVLVFQMAVDLSLCARNRSAWTCWWQSPCNRDRYRKKVRNLMSPVSAEEPSGTFRYTPHCYYFIYLFYLWLLFYLFIYFFIFFYFLFFFHSHYILHIFFFINCALVYINFLRILCLFAFVIDIFTTTSITLCIYLNNNIFTLGLVFHIKLILKKLKTNGFVTNG